MDKNNEFFTLKGYQLIEETELTPAMEDYLEMICRINKTTDKIRVSTLSKQLNVKPSSTSKMIDNLGKLKYINSEKYGNISLTQKGVAAGNYLLYRHSVINRFLCLVNNSKNELEEVEKIEHFLSKKTVKNIDRFINNVLNNKLL